MKPQKERDMDDAVRWFNRYRSWIEAGGTPARDIAIHGYLSGMRRERKVKRRTIKA